jgi:hypothetical protein
MESILGRSLREDEDIAINVYKPAPLGKEREEASQRLLERIDKTAQKARGVPEDELEAAIWIMFDTTLNENYTRYRDSRSYECESHRTCQELPSTFLSITFLFSLGRTAFPLPCR